MGADWHPTLARAPRAALCAAPLTHPCPGPARRSPFSGTMAGPIVLMAGLQVYRKSSLDLVHAGAMDPAWFQSMFATTVVAAMCLAILIICTSMVVASR